MTEVPDGFEWINKPVTVRGDDFTYEATCLCKFPKTSGKIRYIVEDRGRLFIQRDEQLTFLTPMQERMQKEGELEEASRAASANQAQGVSDLRERIYKVLCDYNMSNFVFDDDDHAPYSLKDLCTPDGEGIDKGEEELFLIADEIAAALAGVSKFVDPSAISNPPTQPEFQYSTWRVGKWGDGSTMQGKANIFCDKWEVTIAQDLDEDLAEEIVKAHNESLK